MTIKKVWDIEYELPLSRIEAMANLDLWASSGFPDRDYYGLWAYVPYLRCLEWGSDDGIEIHHFILSYSVPGDHHRSEYLVPSAKVLNMDRHEVYELFKSLLIVSR